jgi:hypothetical protein
MIRTHGFLENPFGYVGFVWYIQIHEARHGLDENEKSSMLKADQLTQTTFFSLST